MRGKWVAGAAGPLLALAFWAGTRVGERRASAAWAAGAPRTCGPQQRPDGAITPEELKAAIQEQAEALRQQPPTSEGRRELLKGLVRFELMAREALRKGYGSDPELARQAKRSLVARFLERELDEPLSRKPVEEPELREYYEAHRGDYQRPERVRVSDHFFEASSGGAAERARAKAAALAALADPPPGENDPGDLGFMTRAQLEVRAGPAVAAAAFEHLGRSGPSGGMAVETPHGFHAVKLLGRESALDLRMEDVREPIRRRILFERKSRAYEALARELEARAGVPADAALLDSLVAEALHAP